tara:strand:+ start:8691 stop:9407 length:717 start_codon:yes stop_codon:yes gene_type:complete
MKKKIKALLLSAGFGTRLKPLTNNTPKCLVEINGQPLLLNWLNKLERIGCDEVLINTHYLSSQVEKVINQWDQRKLKVRTVYEEKLLGTAGTLRNNSQFFENSLGFLIHTDNFTTLDLNKFLNSHNQRQEECTISMVTFKTNNPTESGIVEIDKSGVLINYFEKIKNPPSNIANGALFLFEESFLNYFLSLPNSYENFCADVIPLLQGKVQTYFTNDLFIDIGTPASLKLAIDLSKNL